MKVVCSYCRKEMGRKYPFRQNIVSHGICQDCYDYYQDQMDGLALDQFLNKFDAPLMVVDTEGRVVSSNKKAAEMGGKSQIELFDLLGGDAMECAYARLPEGCGKTVHCLECGIRNTVQSTMTTGNPQRNVPVKLVRENMILAMMISTKNVGGLVSITIEQIEKMEDKLACDAVG